MYKKMKERHIGENIFIQEFRVFLVQWVKVSVDRLRGLDYERSHMSC